MYKTLQDLDLTPSQRETLEFLIKQTERYEKVRKLSLREIMEVHSQNTCTGVHFDDLIDKR